MSKKLIIIAAGIALLSTAANAQDRWPNWYVGLKASVPFVPNDDISQGTNLGDLEHDTGFGGSLAIGYTPNGSPLRYELEWLHAANDIDKAGSFGSAAGETTVNAGMFNVFYDHNLRGSSLTPYIGAGLGWADVALNSSTLSVDSSDSSFAYQFMAGLAIEPSFMPNTVWSAGYRYFGVADDLQFDPSGTNTIMEYSQHAVEVGARFRF